MQVHLLNQYQNLGLTGMNTLLYNQIILFAWSPACNYLQFSQATATASEGRGVNKAGGRLVEDKEAGYTL